jgi:RsiW-degrading membrane proteinase PrsW (M82 family)
VHAPLSPSARPNQATDADRLSDLLPLGDWYRHHSLRSWPVLLFLALICVPSIALYIVGSSATTTTFDAGAWIFAAYFAIAWLLLLGVIIRPMHVTRLMLLLVTVVALLTEVPLAVALETSLHATNASLLPSIVTIGLPEEIAKALPILVVALVYRNRRGLTPRDYLFVGAVSGLVFGAGEVVRYFTVNGVDEFYQTVQGALPSIVHLIQNGHAPSTSIFAALIGPVLYFILNFVWRFVTDPISHACWAGLTGYFIGLAVTGKYRWYQVAWIGVVVAAILHGFNDWSRINGHYAWILVTLISGILFLGYAKVGSRHDLRLGEADLPEFMVPHPAHPLQPTHPIQPRHAAAPSGADGMHHAPAPHAPAPRAPVSPEPAGSRRGRPWWEH